MNNLFLSVLLLLNASLSPVVIVSGLIGSLIIVVLFSARHPVFRAADQVSGNPGG